MFSLVKKIVSARGLENCQLLLYGQLNLTFICLIGKSNIVDKNGRCGETLSHNPLTNENVPPAILSS